jgi:phenylacetate-CoA ligase
MTPAPHALPPVDPWMWARTLGDVCAAGLDPAGEGRRQRDARLVRLLEVAARDSPFYRRRLGADGQAMPRFDAIEPVDKAELMQHFDAWATDRRVTRASVEDFLSDPGHLADAYLGDYLVWTSSGTSGHPGIFVQDAQSLAVFDALDAIRLRGAGATAAPWASAWGPLWGSVQRFAFVAATGGHFAGVASIERLRRIAERMTPPLAPWLGPQIRTFSVQDTLHDLSRELQDFAPTVLISYPSAAAALAQLQADGALALNLSEVWVGGEQLTPQQRLRIGAAFGCTLRNNYGASEFFSIAGECAHGRLHLNDDWLVLEPVDDSLRPVPPGEASHSVLLTNLANHVQPLLRYRLGDSVRFVPEPCPCGNRLPVIEVQGRADQALVLHDAHDRRVTLLPLALVTVIEEGAHVAQFQLLCTGPAALELRFEAEVADPAAAFVRARAALGLFLAQQGLAHVGVTHGRRAPVRHAGSGKLSRVLTEAFAASPGKSRKAPGAGGR